MAQTEIAQTEVLSPNFNLWTEAWLTIETTENELVDLSLSAVLKEAHRLHTIFDPSPLVVMSVHRLLVAILQATYAPQHASDLVRIWSARRFDASRIDAFGKQFAGRFDLFSESEPFLQSADISITAERDAKSAGYLFPDLPAGTAVTHYTHLYDEKLILCAACAAKGLVTVPAFASSGGAGIKPSINGVPPLYVLPGGASYFESLAASLTTPTFQPVNAAVEGDQAWWQREAVVQKKGIVDKVGYLHSLTFPARRVRLHPVQMDEACTRCGQETKWGVRRMVFDMGESRADDAAIWQDPFAAYRLPSGKADSSSGPRPVRPKEGQASWREFNALFLTQELGSEEKERRPRVLDQLDELDQNYDVLPFGDAPIPFRVIGVRTDGKMKYFEWQEEGFLVPPRVLHDLKADFAIRQALDLAETIAGQIGYIFRQHFGGEARDRERFQRLKSDMIAAYWQGLAAPFRVFILKLGAAGIDDQTGAEWARLVAEHGNRVFQDAAQDAGSDGAALRRQVEAINHCSAMIYTIVRKKLAQEE